MILNGNYPDFSGITTLEELTLAMARKILAVQKNTTYNPNGIDLINITCDEETSKISIDLTGLRGQVDENGVIVIDEVFRGSGYFHGNASDSYPFNREWLTDAFFHLAVYHMIQEKKIGINKQPEINQYVNVGIATGTLDTSDFPLDINITVTDYPVIITPQVGGGSLCKAKTYLG